MIGSYTHCFCSETYLQHIFSFYFFYWFRKQASIKNIIIKEYFLLNHNIDNNIGNIDNTVKRPLTDIQLYLLILKSSFHLFWFLRKIPIEAYKFRNRSYIFKLWAEKISKIFDSIDNVFNIFQNKKLNK